MNRNLRPFTRLVIGTLVVFLAGGWWLANRHAALRASEARICEITAANQRAIAALRRRQSAESAAAGQQSAQTDPAIKAATDASSTSNFASGSRISARLRTMSEFAPHERRELRRRTMLAYGDLFAQLNLPADRLEALKLILDENNGTFDDAFTEAYAQGYAQSSPQFQQLTKYYTDEAEGRVRAFLNADEYNRYADYSKSVGWRNSQLPELQCYLGLHGLPGLTSVQKTALAAAYLETQTWQAPGTTGLAGKLFRLRNERFGQNAAGVLSPEQQVAVIAYLRFVNEKSELLGRLLNPQNPDAFAITVGGD